MKHPSERLEELINALGHNLNSFSMECGYKNATTIWSIIAKKKKPSTPTLNKICNAFPNINRRWIISGNESMFIDEPIQAIQELTVTAKQIIDYLKPIIPDPNTVLKIEQTMVEVKESLKQTLQIKKDIANINAKITTMQLVTGYEAIKKESKEKNKNGQ